MVVQVGLSLFSFKRTTKLRAIWELPWVPTHSNFQNCAFNFKSGNNKKEGLKIEKWDSMPSMGTQRYPWKARLCFYLPLGHLTACPHHFFDTIFFKEKCRDCHAIAMQWRVRLCSTHSKKKSIGVVVTLLCSTRTKTSQTNAELIYLQMLVHMGVIAFFFFKVKVHSKVGREHAI